MLITLESLRTGTVIKEAEGRAVFRHREAHTEVQLGWGQGYPMVDLDVYLPGGPAAWERIDGPDPRADLEDVPTDPAG